MTASSTSRPSRDGRAQGARAVKPHREVVRALVVVAALLSIGGGEAPAWGGALPERPRLSVDTTYVPPPGRTLTVPKGGDLQEALDRAQPGDAILLEAGATFRGPFTLPSKDGTGWIVVRTSAPDDRLPPPGTRVDPSYASVMPTLEAGSGSVIATAPGAHHYRFVGIEIRPVEGAFLYDLVGIGVERSRALRLLYDLLPSAVASPSPDDLPHHIVFDRCFLHGDPEKGGRRGIALNGRDLAVIDSYLSDFKEVRADSQALMGWNGPGPFKIVNNYLEAAGENVMFGGADPTIPGLVPADIEIRGNHFSKPLHWRLGQPGYTGPPWTVKNLFELKNARRVLIEGNLFEQSWVHAQNGFAILFTVRNQDGEAPWSVVEDVTFVNNIVRRTARGINIHGFDTAHPSRQSRRILIRNNLFEDVEAARWGGGCCAGWLQITHGAADVVVEHNTALHTDNIVTGAGEPNPGFVFRHNIAVHNAFGIVGTGTRPGSDTLKRYFPGALVERNVMVGGSAAHYPPDNLFPPSLDDVGFVDRAGGNYRLATTSRYRQAGPDRTDLGVDVDALPKPRAGRPDRRGDAPER
jgi:hypothetical protein